MDNNWKLDKIEIEFQSWGENKGKYAGKIRFSNGDQESFVFKIRPDMADAYIKIMSSDIVTSAENLGQRLIDSLGLKEIKGNG
ncbi:MAG: hypothetical protein LBF27_25685 [Sphingobacterium sp.]|jgi:hypothetical protein|nr:hypothetical protein [Sphingobacterium sp.]